jgi:C-terminal of NADH-ubiquinone oxidoreductase 21 kDa subunit
MDLEEMIGKLRAGEPLYGNSEMDLYHQQVAASQSRWAQLKFRMLYREYPNEDIFPFFNFANHSQHGVDIEKYLKAWPEEERDKILSERKERLEKFKEAFTQGKEKTDIEIVKP